MQMKNISEMKDLDKPKPCILMQAWSKSDEKQELLRFEDINP